MNRILPFGGTDDSSQPPVVSTNLTLVSAGGLFDGLVTSAFQGFDPALTGALTLGIGQTAYELAAADPAAAALGPVVAGSPVPDPTVVTAISFATPANGFEDPTTGTIGLAATTAGFASLVLPLEAGLQGTELGKELAPLLNLSGGLLPGFTRHHGVPTGGSEHAAPFLALNAGLGLSQTVTVLGLTTSTHEHGSVTVGKATGQALASTAADGATVLLDAGTLLADVESGNLLGAAGQGVQTLADSVVLGASLGPLLSAAAQQHDPTLPAIRNPVLSLNLQSQAGQTFSLGIGTPTQITETLGLSITADKYGDYALGKLLGQIAPQVIADYSGGGTTTAFDALAQLAQGVSALAHDAAGGFSGLGNAGAVPSLAGPDISIGVTLGLTESQNTLVGSITNSQTFAVHLETNAQGLYDIGTASQPLLVDLLVAALHTDIGQEIVQIGGDILSQLDAKFGGGSVSLPHQAEQGPAMVYVPHHWGM